LRALIPTLAGEGLDAVRLVLLARRLRRADAAIEAAVTAAAAVVTDGVWSDRGPIAFDAKKFGALPAEVALRLIGRAIARVGNEGPVELGKLEALYAAMGGALDGIAPAAPAEPRLRRTLAGALMTLSAGRLLIERAPLRSSRRGRKTLTTRKRSTEDAAKRR